MGAVEDMGPEVKINIDMSSADASFEFAGQTIFSTGGNLWLTPYKQAATAEM